MYSDFIITISFVLIIICMVMTNIFTFLSINSQSHKNKDFIELIQILGMIINTELEKYDNDIFKDSGIISNAAFDNRYNEITNLIISSISPKFMKELTSYITEDTIIRYIARSVKDYLSKKVIGSV